MGRVNSPSGISMTLAFGFLSNSRFNASCRVGTRFKIEFLQGLFGKRTIRHHNPCMPQNPGQDQGLLLPGSKSLLPGYGDHILHILGSPHDFAVTGMAAPILTRSRDKNDPSLGHQGSRAQDNDISRPTGLIEVPALGIGHTADDNLCQGDRSQPRRDGAPSSHLHGRPPQGLPQPL